MLKLEKYDDDFVVTTGTCKVYFERQHALHSECKPEWYKPVAAMDSSDFRGYLVEGAMGRAALEWLDHFKPVKVVEVVELTSWTVVEQYPDEDISSPCPIDATIVPEPNMKDGR